MFYVEKSSSNNNNNNKNKKNDFPTKEEFRNLYYIKIQNLKLVLSKQFREICYDKNVFCDVQIVDNGTRVEYKENKNVNNGCVSYEKTFTLYIGFDEIETMYNNTDYDAFECLNKIISHEYLHILFGDFEKAKLNNMYNFNLGVKKSNVPDSPFFVKSSNNNNIFDETGYIKIDKKLSNICFDLVINEVLEIGSPFINYEDLEVPPSLNCFEYYSILYQDLKNGNNKTLNMIYECIDVDSNNIESHERFNKDVDSPIVPKYKNKAFKKFNMDNIVSKINKYKGSGSYKNKIFEKFSTSNIAKYVKFRNFMSKIIKGSKFTKLSYIDRIDDWTRYNNRKAFGNMLYPGKIEVTNGFLRKFRPCPVVFVDCSESMYDIAEIVYCFCYSILGAIDARIVFYDTEILDVYDDANALNMPYYNGGGTSIAEVLKEYEEKYRILPSDIYVITDGVDYYPSTIKKENILIVDNNDNNIVS